MFRDEESGLVRGEAWEVKFEGQHVTCRFLRLETSATPGTCRNNVIAETFTVSAGGSFVTRGWLPSNPDLCSLERGLCCRGGRRRILTTVSIFRV